MSRGNLRKIKCGTFRKLPLIAFPQPKHSAFPQIAKLMFARIVQQMCNQSLLSVFFLLVCLPKNMVVFLQFRLTSKSLPHSKCHAISLIDVIGFNLYNRCDSRMDDHTKLIMFNSCDTGQNHCHMRAAATPIAMTIASCKHRVKGQTIPQVTSVLTSFFWNAVMTLHIT